MVKELIKSIQSRDPANPTTCEVILAYPGFHVLGFHAVASRLWKMELRALSRFISHLGRFFTGIEIHPGAKIGKNLFIDHGMGVVIGETAIVGDNVRMYHCVTLGGRGGEAPGTKRHPTIGDNVIIGAGATIVGNVRVGNGAIVKANTLILSDIPDAKPAALVAASPDLHAPDHAA